MTYKMFLDDERFPASNSGDWVVIRSSADAIRMVQLQGIPSFISFDHDLGGDDTSRKFVKWLSDYMMDNHLTFQGRDFDFYVHSQNPIGADWIRNMMTSMMGNI